VIGEFELIRAWRGRGIVGISRAWIATICNLLSSAFLVVWGVIVIPAARWLTVFEHWESWTRFHLSQALKIVLLRVILLIVMFVFTSALSQLRLTGRAFYVFRGCFVIFFLFFLKLLAFCGIWGRK
jgi:hypothetical protein